MDDRHLNLFSHYDSLSDAYAHLKRDQGKSLDRRAHWQLAFLATGAATIGALYRGDDWWVYAALACLLCVDRSFWHAIEVSNRNYCMHVMTMLSHLEWKRNHPTDVD